MKNKMIHAIGGIDDKFIDEAARPSRKKAVIIKWCAAAAGFCVIAGLAAAVWISSGANGIFLSKESNAAGGALEGTLSEEYDGDYKANGTADTAPGDSETYTEEADDMVSEPTSSHDMYEVPRWDDMTVTQKFPYLSFNGYEYSTADKVIPEDKVGKKITSATLTGTDRYTGKTYAINADIYGIAGISKNCAVSLKFEGYDELYVCRNSGYRPETLGQLTDDLNLKKTLTFGKAYATVQKDKNSYAQTEYSGLDGEKVWEMLFSDRNLKNVKDYDSMNFGKELISVSINIELLGYENISLTVTEDGYLTTNILDTGKAFFIGKEKAENFAEYVRENCKAVEKGSFTAPSGGNGGGAGEPADSGAASSAYDPGNTASRQ